MAPVSNFPSISANVQSKSKELHRQRKNIIIIKSSNTVQVKQFKGLTTLSARNFQNKIPLFLSSFSSKEFSSPFLFFIHILYTFILHNAPGLPGKERRPRQMNFYVCKKCTNSLKNNILCMVMQECKFYSELLKNPHDMFVCLSTCSSLKR